MPAAYPGPVSNETQAQPGDALIRTGVVVFAVGAAATVATVTPLLLGLDPLPTAAYLVSMLMGAGFALAIAGTVRTVNFQRRQVRAARVAQSALDRRCARHTRKAAEQSAAIRTTTGTASRSAGP